MKGTIAKEWVSEDFRTYLMRRWINIDPAQLLLVALVEFVVPALL